MNDEVQKAFGMDEYTKAMAISAYKRSLVVLADSYGSWRESDAHTELSDIFFENWHRVARHFEDNKPNDVRLINCAFNYANFILGIKGKFFKTAEEVLGDQYCAEARWLNKAAREMDSILTFV